MSGFVLLNFRIQPNASRNQVVEILADGRIKVKIQAPPVEGKANKSLTRYLSDVFRVRESDIEIVRGETSRDKTVRIQGWSESDAIQEINRIISN